VSRSRRKPQGPGDVPPLPGNPSDPRGFRVLGAAFLEWEAVTGRTEYTRRAHHYRIGRFVRWALPRGLSRPEEITRPMLERYQRHLFHHRKPDGKPMTMIAQHGNLSCLKVFFRWLTRQGYLLWNPAADLDLPRFAQHLPADVLSVDEIERVLSAPDLARPEGIRDRAILETLYSTGMRRMELSRLAVSDISPERGIAVIREGKGKKDRVVPIGSRALAWIERYLADVRPELVYPPDPGHLFLRDQGEPLPIDALSRLARKYLDAAGVSKRGACHLFRHAMATLMLENGADVRFIQEILGHTSLESTQIYTHVSIRHLKEVHASTHPGAQLVRKNGDGEQLKKESPGCAAAPADVDRGREALEEALLAEALEEADAAK
jgi:integrase/recombinase XerD